MGLGWRKGRTEGDAEEAEDPALEAAGVARLRGLRQRVGEVQAEAAGAVSPSADDRAPIALAANPFALLNVDVTAGRAAINDAFEELSFEPGHDPAALTAARAALMSPRDRLAAEIRWVPGLPDLTRRALVAALRSRDMATIASIRDKASGIARINLAFALLHQDAAHAASVVADARLVDADALLERLDEARFAAREREIERSAFDEALHEWATEIGAAAAIAFASTPAARAALTQALKAHPEAAGRFDASFREALLKGYGHEIARPLDQSHARIVAGIAALRAEPGSQVHATSLLTALDIWSSLRRPMQLHEAARGLDDPASGEIFASVTELTVVLSNDHDEYDIALRLGRALLACFALVPTQRAALERQLPTLIGNAGAKRAKQLHEAALAQPRAFAGQVEAGGLEGAIGLAGMIGGLIRDIDDMYKDDAVEAMFMIVRDIGIKLHNDHNQVKAAYVMTSWLATQGPPAAVAQRLEEDLKHFGVRAEVAPRNKEAPTTEEPAAPRSFGRARPSGAPSAPGRSGEAPPASPPRSVPGRERRTPKAPPIPAKVRRRAGASWWQVGLVIVMLGSFISAKEQVRSDRRAERQARLEERRNTPARQASRQPRSGRSAEQIVADWKREEVARRAHPAPPRPGGATSNPLVFSATSKPATQP